MSAQDAALLASLTGYVGLRWPRRMASDVAPDLHRIATEQAVEVATQAAEIARLRSALETASIRLQWCAEELPRGGVQNAARNWCSSAHYAAQVPL